MGGQLPPAAVLLLNQKTLALCGRAAAAGSCPSSESENLSVFAAGQLPAVLTKSGGRMHKVLRQLIKGRLSI